MAGSGVISAMVMARGDPLATRRAFERAGFEVGDEVGGTFAITAAPEVFERAFGTKLELGSGGATVKGSAADPLQLPVESLSDELRDGVSIATFSAPPDFGPTGW